MPRASRHARGATATTTCSTARKAFISGGGISDIYVCMVRTGERGPKGISCIVVEKGTPGLSFGAQEKKLGWKSQPTAMVMFENCRVPAANRIGAEGEGFRSPWPGSTAAGSISPPARSAARSSASTAPSPTCASASSSAAGLSDFQALRFRIADFATELEAARLMLRRAAVAVAGKEPGATRLAAMAKRLATDTGFDVVNGCLQLHGGYGYLRDHPIERVLRDVRVHQILEGHQRGHAADRQPGSAGQLRRCGKGSVATRASPATHPSARSQHCQA